VVSQVGEFFRFEYYIKPIIEFFLKGNKKVVLFGAMNLITMVVQIQVNGIRTLIAMVAEIMNYNFTNHLETPYAMVDF